MRGLQIPRKQWGRWLSWMALLVMLAGCMPVQPMPPVSAQPAAEVAIDVVVNTIWREYESSLLAGDSERWLALWDEEGVQMPPGAPPVVGKAAITEKIRGGLAAVQYTEFAINNLEAVEGDGWAFARGLYIGTYVPKAGGDAVSIDGKYMTIFKQQPDGSWRIYRDIFNANTAPAP